MTYTFFFFFFRCAGNEVVKRLGLSALYQAKSDEDILKSLTDIKVSQRVTFRGSGALPLLLAFVCPQLNMQKIKL